MTTPPFDASPTEPFRPAPPEPGPVPGPQPAFGAPPAPGGPPAPGANPAIGGAPGAGGLAMPVTEPLRPHATSRAAGSSRLLNIALGAALLIAASGVSFAVGRVTAPAATTGGAATVPGGLGDGNGLRGNGYFPGGFRGNGYFPGGFGGEANRGFGGLGGGVTIEGTVDSTTPTSVTIKLPSGQTITVGLTADTTYHQQADATASDVQAGKTVILRLSGGFRANGSGAAGNGNGNGAITFGPASDVTVVP